jgi:hypothetical protein
MSMTPITKKQFIGWFIVFTIGMALWASPSELLGGIGLGIMAIGNVILMAPRERSRPLPAREVLWIFGSLLVFAVLAFVSNRWLPDDFGAPVARAVRHPALVAILWALVAWFTYRRYRISKTDAHNGA